MAWWHRPIGPMLIRILKPSVSFCGFLIMFFLGIGSVEFARPVDGTDKQAERVFAQLLGGTRRLDDGGQDRGPALGLGEAAALIDQIGRASCRERVGPYV